MTAARDTGLMMVDPRVGHWHVEPGNPRYTEGVIHAGLSASRDPLVIERMANFLRHGQTITAACGATLNLSDVPERSIPCPCGDEGSYIFRWLR